MRNIPTRAAALLLAVLLALGPAASASEALGTEIHMGRSQLAEGVDYTRQYLWSATYSDLRTERYIEYSPSDLVRPVVAYGDTVLEKNTLSSLALGLEDEGLRVLGGVNGDYYVMATGAPLGMVVTDGVLRSSSAYHYALGFDEEGNAFIGKPELSITATFGGYTLSVSGGLNKVRGDMGSFVLYTEDYSATTNHTGPGIDVILTPSDENLGEKVQVDLEIEEVEEPEAPTDEAEEPADEADPTDETEEPADETEEPADEGEESTDEGADGVTDSADLDQEELDELAEQAREDEEKEDDGEAEQIKDTLVYTDVPIIGGRISCTVEQVLHSDGSIDIPEGKLVLSINNNSNEWLVSQLASLREGDTVNIDVTSPDERWEGAVTAVGALYKLVTDGKAESGLETTQAPRTAVGVKADGTTVFYAVDGRQSGYSVGASMAQVAQRLVELGCVEAVCMDGGGSTTLGAALPGWESFNVLNKPSGGAQRAVSNALFLVAELEEPGEAERLVLSPNDALLLAGAKLEVSALGVDQLGQAVKLYESDEVDLDLPRDGGSVEDGLLTAGDTPGIYTLEAKAGRLRGEALITVVTTPDRIAVRREDQSSALSALSLEPGETVSLNAAAMYRNLSLVCQDEAFTWAVTEGLGTIDEGGTLTAGDGAGTGAVTVTAGEKTVTIPLSVAGQVRTVEDFEGAFQNMADTLTARIEPEWNSAHVRYGGQSARVTYDMTGQEYAAVSVPLDIQEGEKYFSLWVYGDGSGNTLTAPVRLTDGSSSEQILAVLNFTGWLQLLTPLPEGADQVLALKLYPTGTQTQGAIWLDQVTASNYYVTDDTPPTVALELSEGELRAELADNTDAGFPAERVTVTYDGLPVEFTLEGGTVTALLPESDGLAHRVTVTATDASGNIGRASADVAAREGREEPFIDVGEHWAKNYVNYLYDQGISNGVATEEGLTFQADKEINRGEFALMAARWLRVNLEAYSGVELPFADGEAIPDWMLPGIRAMYALGVMQGSAEADGLYAFAEKPISRAEAMTMLGRIQNKGYGKAELTFPDAADIPSWAVDYLATLVCQGVIGGDDNGVLAPGNNIKRGEMAKILYAMR